MDRWAFAVLKDDSNFRGHDLTLAQLPWDVICKSDPAKIFCSKNLFEIIEWAQRLDSDFLLIQSSGHLITRRLLAELDNQFSQSPCDLIGHLISDSDEHCRLNKQCLALRLDQFRTIELADWPRFDFDYPLRNKSTETIHDNYTPLTAALEIGPKKVFAENFSKPTRGFKKNLYKTESADSIGAADSSELTDEMSTINQLNEYWQTTVSLQDSQQRIESVTNAIHQHPPKTLILRGLSPHLLSHIDSRRFKDIDQFVFYNEKKSEIDLASYALSQFSQQDFKDLAIDFLKTGEHLYAIDDKHQAIRWDQWEIDKIYNLDQLSKNLQLICEKKWSVHHGELTSDYDGLCQWLGDNDSPTLFEFFDSYFSELASRQSLSERTDAYRAIWGLAARDRKNLILCGRDPYANETQPKPVEFEIFARENIAKVSGAVQIADLYQIDTDQIKLTCNETPYRQIDIDFPQEAFLKEAKNLFDQARFVSHRCVFEKNFAWLGVCLFGARESGTKELVPVKSMNWTEASQLCPTITDYFKNHPDFEITGRIRIMALLPGGFIAPHKDQKESYFSTINFALNHPEECEFHFPEKTIVPFQTGSAFALDISQHHWVINRSQEVRFHVIPHGRWSFLSNSSTND